LRRKIQFKEYHHRGVLAEYDSSPKEREEHAKKMKKWRAAQWAKRKKAVPTILQLTVSLRHACTHPETKLERKQTYTRTFEVIPPCPHCHQKVSLEFESFWILNKVGKRLKLVETYRCRKCKGTVSPWKYEQLKNKTFMACPKRTASSSKECAGHVKPQQVYPWIFECPKCHEVYPPERKEELLNVKINYTPQLTTRMILPKPGSIKDPKTREFTYIEHLNKMLCVGEDAVDGDLYQCPVYGGVKRVRDDSYCKNHCGFREQVTVQTPLRAKGKITRMGPYPVNPWITRK